MSQVPKEIIKTTGEQSRDVATQRQQLITWLLG